MAAISDDDLTRQLTVAKPNEAQNLPLIGLVGDNYTSLVTGDFEEMLRILEGDVSVTLRGQTMTAAAGETINVPANAPHSFSNVSEPPTRLLCLCATAGQDEFFTLVGQPTPGRTEAASPLDAEVSRR